MTRHERTGFFGIPSYWKKTVVIATGIVAVGGAISFALPYLNGPNRQDATDATLASMQKNASDWQQKRQERDIRDEQFQRQVLDRLDGLEQKHSAYEFKINEAIKSLRDDEVELKGVTQDQQKVIDSIKNSVVQLEKIKITLTKPISSITVPSGKFPVLDSMAVNNIIMLPLDQIPFFMNVINHNTRAENEARREAEGVPPAPSKNSQVKKDKALINEAVDQVQGG